MSVELLFSYGSLQRGQRYAEVTQQLGLQYVGTGYTLGFWLYHLPTLGFPACLTTQASGDGQVWGELYQVPNTSWLQLDHFEQEYQRCLSPVYGQHGSGLAQAWIYIWAAELPARAEHVPDGHWVNWLTKPSVPNNCL